MDCPLAPHRIVAPRPQELAYGWALKVVPEAIVPSRTQLFSSGNETVLPGNAFEPIVTWLRFSDKHGNVIHTLPAGTSLGVFITKAGAAQLAKSQLELNTEQLSASFNVDEMGFRWDWLAVLGGGACSQAHVCCTLLRAGTETSYSPCWCLGKLARPCNRPTCEHAKRRWRAKVRPRLCRPWDTQWTLASNHV